MAKLKRSAFAGVLALFALLAAACGSSDGATVSTGEPAPTTTPAAIETPAEEAPTPEEAPTETPAVEETPTETPAAEEMTGFPVTVAHGLGEITFDSAPQRIVSLSPTATEMLFAIGAGSQVLAVDDQSNFPAEAPVTDLSGFTPSVEAIIGFEPDLVISQGLPEDIDAGLAAAGIPSMALFFGAVLDDTATQLEQLGAATGHIDEAAELVASMQADLDAIAATVPERDRPLTYYHELDNTLFSATSTTFIGQIYAMAGLENIADAADTEGFGFPQLSAEYIIDEDPDFIFLADTKCCAETADTLAARPGWGQLSAVVNGNVIELDDDVASRWGPRIVDFFRVVVDATSQFEPAATS